MMTSPGGSGVSSQGVDSQVMVRLGQAGVGGTVGHGWSRCASAPFGRADSASFGASAHGGARSVMAGSAWFGATWLVGARSGMAVPVRLGRAGQGVVVHGGSRQGGRGEHWSGPAYQDRARRSRWGPTGRGKSRLGAARQGSVRLVVARRVLARRSWPGGAGQGKEARVGMCYGEAVLVRRRAARQRVERTGESRCGEAVAAWLGRIGRVLDRPAWRSGLGTARRGWARLGRHGMIRLGESGRGESGRARPTWIEAVGHRWARLGWAVKVCGVALLGNPCQGVVWLGGYGLV
jgi:hypothetical protein